ncbi:synaptotagmin-1-like [Gigantopelta aegis]|uniref:synaptotagmin-1-like n=1 Tax=Gigantopelta aegis TaxID=1735272 RepID=UPI001B889EFB|nr:synaptotagmin-1-like [Gigantopelta aegis]
MGGSQSHEISPEERRLRQDPEKILRIARFLNTQAEKRKAGSGDLVEWNQHDQDKQSMQLLKGLFKQLDPSVTSTIGDNNGEVQLSFKYDGSQNLLLVKVLKCRDLRNRDIRSKASDPYVKLEMHPDLHGEGGHTTQIVVETNSPVFNEIFSFTLSELEILDAKLIIQVWDYDVTSRDDFLGEVIVNMNTFNFKQDPIHTAWYTLRMQTDLSVSGEIDVSLSYQVPDRLFVSVLRATNLSPRDDRIKADPFVKLTIPGVGVMHRTQVKKSTLDPVWQETFEFSVPIEELAFRYIILHVIDESHYHGNESLGQVIIDLDSFDLEKGSHQIHRLTDLKNSERIRNKMFQSRAAQEFRESFMAHACVRCPGFLFQMQSGKKVVSVSCRKAGSHARIRIVDGILIN